MMSMKMSIDAYRELIEGNMRWLGNQPSSCERNHIMGIVKDSTRFYYSEDNESSLATMRNELEEAYKSAEVIEVAAYDLAVSMGREPEEYDTDAAYEYCIANILKDAGSALEKFGVAFNDEIGEFVIKKPTST